MHDLEATSHGSGSADDVARQLRGLSSQIASLQADVRRLESAPLPREGDSGWEERAPPPGAFSWISSLETPQRARVRIPRLPLELAFLAGAAVLAGLAHLRPPVIAGVMLGAWAIVVLAEWAGSRGDRLRHQLALEGSIRAPQSAAVEVVRADPTWFTPPVEHTLIARPASSETPEQPTTITTLPPPDAETTADRSGS